MELRQLEYFDAVVKNRNYTKAAQSLHVSQPTISISIQRLEEELGLISFKRDSKRIVLTEEGREFLIYARNILKTVENALKAAEDMRINNKKVVKFVFPSTVGSWLWRFINMDFRNRYPDIEVVIKDYGCSEIIKLLRLGKADLGFGVIDLVEGSGLETKVIGEGNMKVIISKDHVYADLDEISLKNLEDDLIIMYQEGTTYVECRMREEFKKYNLKPRIRHVIEQSTVYDLVAQNLGISFTLDDSATFIKYNKYILSKKIRERIAFKIGLIWDGNNFLSTSTRILMDEIISQRHKLY